MQIAETLWRWTAAHPEWNPQPEPGSPADWDRMVGSVLYLQGDAVAVIDPQLPSERRGEFLAWLDALIDRRAVSVLTTIRWHRRDRAEILERYRAGGADAGAAPGVHPFPLRGAGETVYWIPSAGTLVPGDSLIGDPDGVRVCPESWLADQEADRAGLARLLVPLLELPVQRILVSHGEPVLHAGHEALARATQEALR